MKYENNYADFFNYNPKYDEVFNERAKRTPYRIDECRDCIALSNCGGGCPRNAENISGSIWNVDKSFCTFSKKACEWMIWENYKNEKFEK